MAKPYTIQITNGTGSGRILNDTYSVTGNVNGFDNTSILPTSTVVDGNTTVINFTIEATGTLTCHITEEGTADGTPVEGASLIRCDSAGTAYGTAVITNALGNAVFENVPFAENSAPVIYYKQTASDGEHEFDNTLKNMTMSQSTSTIEIINTVPAMRTVNLTDLNYEGLSVVAGEITMS